MRRSTSASSGLLLALLVVGCTTPYHQGEGLFEEPKGSAAAGPGGSLPAVGAVRGRVVRGGQGAIGCKVQVVQLVQSGTLLWTSLEAGQVFETESAADGSYEFSEVPAGSYKIRWKPPDSDTWLRFMSEEPDFPVFPGKLTTYKPVDVPR